MDGMDCIDVLGFVTICLGHFIFIPLVLYYKHQKDKLRHKDMFAHRQSALVDIQIGLSAIGILFERLFVCGVAVWILPSLSSLHWLVTIFDGLFIWSILVLFFLRIWLLFFSMKWHQSVAKQAWATHINPNYKSFYILRRDSFGDFCFLLKLLIIPFLFFVAAEAMLETLITSPFVIHLLGLISILLIVPSVIMYRHLDQNKDVFGIKREIAMQCMVLVAISAVHLLLIAEDFAVRFEWLDLYGQMSAGDYDRIQWLIRLFIGSAELFAIPFISTFFPVHLYRKRNRMNRDNLDTSKRFRSFCEDGSSQIAARQQPEHGVFRMLHVLSDPQGFKAFMSHLCTELSSENMLFIYEYIQIKSAFQTVCNGIVKIPKPTSALSMSLQCSSSPKLQRSTSLRKMELIQKRSDSDYLTVDFNVERIRNERKGGSLWKKRDETLSRRAVASYIFNTNGSIFARVVLPANLPKSTLLTQRTKFIDRLYLLYLKYINKKSDLEINISAIQRKRIIRSFTEIMDLIETESEQKEEEANPSAIGPIPKEVAEADNALNFEMFTLLDKACIEVLLLMRQSYERFAVQGSPSLKRRVREGVEMIDYRTQAVRLEILRDGKAYRELRGKCESS